MQNHNWRIFLSYRGDSEGKSFSDTLYHYLTDNPLHENMYGEVYFSPKTAELGHNFKQDIPAIMQDVSYFVMPLTAEYYADFWDEEKNCPNSHSITYHEINTAISVGSRFICIVFPGFNIDENLLKKLFNNDSEKLSCSLLRKYDPKHEEELLREIGDSMVREDYNVTGMHDLLKKIEPNVFLSFKSDTEKTQDFPFYQKLYDVKRITLLNYASSTFITGIDIASNYHESDYLKRWFSFHLSKGNIEADIILTDPHSNAAYDAAKYKMYPVGLNIKKEDIILQNMNRLFKFMKTYPDAKLNIYLTHIALPYGVMMTEHTNPKNNHIKVDLYSAVTDDDRNRPSFYLLQSNNETKNLYSFFEGNVRRIMSEYSYSFNGHPEITWLFNKPIIHRGLIKRGLLPHTKSAYEACIEANYPIEVDLLQMKDETVIVARNDQDISEYGYEKKLSELELHDLRQINRKAQQNKILTLDEFLWLINGRIPILLEIKTIEKKISDDLIRYVKKVVTSLQRYSNRCSEYFGMNNNSYGQGFAVHSADPNVLTLIKDIDCLIPCGIITKDFTSLKDIVGEEFYEIHRSASYIDSIQPDFISCDVNYLGNSNISNLCNDKNIPLLAWTITNEDEQYLAEDYNCENIIIEGSKSFI